MKTMIQNIDELRGQCAQRDIKNSGPVTFVETISSGLNLVGNQGEIHVHLTLGGAEIIAALVNLLNPASRTKQKTRGSSNNSQGSINLEAELSRIFKNSPPA